MFDAIKLLTVLLRARSLGADPCHCQPERIIMGFFQDRIPFMHRLYIVKEHVDVALTAHVNIQIAILGGKDI